MPYDKALADRLRALLADHKAVTEKKMFGGVGFLISGNMAIAASSDGGLLVRADPATGAAFVKTGKARLMTMRGKAMSGWLRVAADDVRTSRQLAQWVDVGTSAARSLHRKRTSA